MATGQFVGYANQTKSAIRPTRKIRKEKMKLTLKQRFRNWLLNEEELEADVPHQIVSEGNRLDSEGMRFQLYRAAGGYVIETRHYDRKTDRHDNKMYVIREDQDVGHELGKIITMESLR